MAGIVVFGSKLTVEATAVRDTQPTPEGLFGRGITLEADPTTEFVSDASIRASSIESSFEFGVLFFGSDGAVEDTVVKSTQPRVSDGLLGDGIAAVRTDHSSTVEIHGSRVDSNARAGITSFGADVTFGTSVLDCNGLDLDGEDLNAPFALEDLGGNRCGCSDASHACQVLSLDLAAPGPVGGSP